MQTSSLRTPSPRPLKYQAARFKAYLRHCLRIGPGLHADRLQDEARRLTRSADFLDTSFREPLEILVRSLNNSARLNAFGRRIAEYILLRALVYRLRLERAWEGATPAEHHHLEPLARPIYLIGPPRTGTTLLLNLLSSDPRARPLRYYESLIPKLQPGERPGIDRRKSQIAQAAHQLREWESVVPALAGIHKVVVDGPEECIFLLKNTLTATHFESNWHAPEYESWIYSRSRSHWNVVYEHYVSTLRWIQGDMTGRHWILKSPVHLRRVPIIADMIPTARFVFTSRDPYEMIASVCSLAYEGRRAFSDHVDPAQIGHMVLLKIRDSLDAIQLASASLGDRIIHIPYESLVSNPIESMQRIYQQFDIPWTDDVANSMRCWLDSNPQGKHGRHQYHLEQFGLNATILREVIGQDFTWKHLFR